MITLFLRYTNVTSYTNYKDIHHFSFYLIGVLASLNQSADNVPFGIKKAPRVGEVLFKNNLNQKA